MRRKFLTPLRITKWRLHECFRFHQRVWTIVRICLALLVLAAVSNFSYSAETGSGKASLINAGFEFVELKGWSLHVYGAKPELTLDTVIRHEGQQSLRVSATEPSDTALTQDIKVCVGQLYRLKLWVKTTNLDPNGAPTYGTCQLQMPNKHFITQGQNHRDNTNWTQETIFFYAPRQGRVRIALFFVGYGKGTGTVWFDDIRLERVRSMKASINVQSDFISDAQIHPFQYGQFMEPLFNLLPSMWTQKLYNTSFEGVNRTIASFRKETDFTEQLWYPIGALNRGDFVLDKQDPFNGKVSQQIGVEGEQRCSLGIAQDGIFVERGKVYNLSVYLRQRQLPEPVRACLRDGAKILAEVKFNPTGKWEKYSATLVPAATTTDATFSLEFYGLGTIWVDQVSLMPKDSVGGWRPDMVEAVRALKPGIIRWGGSTTEKYDWRNLIGDPDRRVPWNNEPWQGIYPTGAGLEEFVQFCQTVNAEPFICVRVTDKEPAEAAAQVEYFNGAPDTFMGRLRAENGHPEPYNVKYWQTGNEVHGNAQRLAAFCKAMKAVDPSIILLSSYPSEEIVRQAGRYIDYLCPHHYGIGNLPKRAAEIENMRLLLAKHALSGKIKMAVTEWNTTAGHWGIKRNHLWTLDNALACSRYHNLIHRYADMVEIANRSNLVGSFCCGILQADNARLYRTPTYYAQQLYAVHAGNRPLKVELNGDLIQNDVSVTLSRDKRSLVLFVVNDRHLERKVTVNLSEFGLNKQAVSTWTLMDTQQQGQRDVINSFDEPQRVRTVASMISIESAEFDYTFPPLSLTVLKCWAKK